MGNALADVLFGDVNPGARLPLTWPMVETDNPLPSPQQYPGVNGVVNYTEGLFIDYRWFDANNVTPRFAFGHGLSYTTFTYADLVVDAASAAPSILVTFSLTNSGGRDGKEVPQLYLTFPPDAGEPPQVLRAFDSVPVPVAGDAVVVKFVLSERDCSVWDVGSYSWKVAKGSFGVAVGASSRDIRLRGTFSL